MILRHIHFDCATRILADWCLFRDDGTQQNTAGPQFGPGITPQRLPPALAASLPGANGGTTYSGATISAGPTGPSQREYVSTPYDPSFAPSSSSTAPSSGPSVHPSRLAQMSSGTAPVAGQVHPREEEQREKPVFKRPKIEKLPYGQLYSVSALLTGMIPSTIADPYHLAGNRLDVTPSRSNDHLYPTPLDARKARMETRRLSHLHTRSTSKYVLFNFARTDQEGGRCRSAHLAITFGL